MAAFSQYNDDALVDLMKGGDQQVFTEIYNRYWEKLYYVAYHHLKDAFGAEEVVQTVFMSLWRKRETLDIQSLSVYLSAMTRYAVYKHLAREKRRTEIESKAQTIAVASTRLDEQLDNKEVMALVRKLTHVLPEKCRMVFVHNKLLDLPLAEVAESMNISIKTAEAHITKALKIVREQMGNALSLLLL